MIRRALLPLLLLLAATDAAALEPRVVAAEEALDAWDVPAARRLAEELRAEAPGSRELANLLGRVLLHDGAYEEAASLFAEAGSSGEDGTYLQLARDTAEVTARYEVAESEHFSFRYPKGKDEVLVPYALDALERAHQRIGDVVGYHLPPGEKIRVEVVDDAEELARVSTLSLEAIKTTGTIAICKFNKLVITSPKALLRGYEWQDTLAHEYVHLIVTRKSRNKTPIWLHEGIAKYLETAWRGPPGLALELPSQALLRDAVKAQKLITFEAMSPSIALLPSAQDAALAFAEVFSAIEFLQKKSDRNVEKILSGLRDGKSDQEAVAGVFGQPFARFEESWRGYLKTRPYPKESASLAELELRFKSDEGAKELKGKELKDASERGEFADIQDARARRAAHLGELLRGRGKMAAAAAKYKAAVDRTGVEYPLLTNKYALSLLELKQSEEARAILERSIGLYPSNAQSRLLLARALMELGKVPDAEPHLIAAIGTDPFDPELHARLVEVAKAKGDAALEKRARRAVALLVGREELGSPEDTLGGSIGGSPESGISIESDLLARVIVDGVDTGLTTPVARLPLPPGRHVVTLERLDGGGKKDFELVVEEGRTASLVGELGGS